MCERSKPEIFGSMTGSTVMMIGTSGMTKLHTVGLLTRCGRMIIITGDMEVSEEKPG